MKYFLEITVHYIDGSCNVYKIDEPEKIKRGNIIIQSFLSRWNDSMNRIILEWKVKV